VSLFWLSLLAVVLSRFNFEPKSLKLLYEQCAKQIISRSEMGRQSAAILKFFDGGRLGISDSSLLLERISRPEHAHLLFEEGAGGGKQSREGGSSLFIDIGANLGATSKAMIDACTRLGILCEIVAFEPSLETFKALESRASLLKWEIHGWRLMRKAVSDPGSVGLRPFFSGGMAGDEQASLSKDASLGGNVSELVDVTTVDAVMDSLEIHQRSLNPLWLKIDAEGFDASVLAGAHRTISQKVFRFISFEYNVKWRYPGSSSNLKESIAMMSINGYNCFFVTDEALVPLWGPWWHDDFEFYRWSNVVCELECKKCKTSLSTAIAQSFSSLEESSKVAPDPSEVKKCLMFV
jgi:hypothetical protein